ncbi:MAG TPA: sugar phosphate nucleotidyltransferase, partial [Flavobacterium sp.]
YASIKIHKINPDALIVVAPSDHWIEDEVAFSENLQKCFDFCSNSDAILTLGIEPTFPNTGYGYIEFEKSAAEIKKVRNFVEKPDYAAAKVFYESDNYLWNGGIFIWSSKSILSAYERYVPQMFAMFQEGLPIYNTSMETEFISKNYGLAENISVDYAIMERASNVFVFPATFDWNDLGTWGSLHEKLPKDGQNNAVVNAKVILENAANNMIRSDTEKLIIIDGLNDYIIVDRDNVLLIYPKSKEQAIKEIISKSNLHI